MLAWFVMKVQMQPADEDSSEQTELFYGEIAKVSFTHFGSFD